MKAERLWYFHIEYADKDKNIFVGYFKKRWKASKKLRDELAKIDQSELVIRAAVSEVNDVRP
jgi:hypothetical protein